jgi:glycosyltransferase involved in cell wall biosynthesis
VTTRLATILPAPLTGRGPSYTCGMLAREMSIRGIKVTIVTPRARGFAVSPADVIEVLPGWTRRLPYRLVAPFARRQLETEFLAFATNPATQARAAYIFADASVEIIMKLKRAGVTVFREQFNCHRGTAKVILDEAYKRLGVAPLHTISDMSISVERQLLDAVDFVFCPSPMVEASLIENGVHASKLIAANYGWDPARILDSGRLLDPCEGITAVYVGTVCVRKGAHLLLDYWVKSGVKGRLILAGNIEPIVKEKCAHFLKANDIVLLNYVKNVGALLRSADIFAFPTLEEGAPLAIYEACGSGLPVITTPMGAGRVVRPNKEGFVLDPYDSAGWISAIRLLAEDSKSRHAMARAAAKRATKFFWAQAANERVQQILHCAF